MFLVYTYVNNVVQSMYKYTYTYTRKPLKMTNNFFKALVDATSSLRSPPPVANTGVHTYYVTEFGKVEGERLYRQHQEKY